jgi:hypothetical protein
MKSSNLSVFKISECDTVTNIWILASNPIVLAVLIVVFALDYMEGVSVPLLV